MQRQHNYYYCYLDKHSRGRAHAFGGIRGEPGEAESGWPAQDSCFGLSGGVSCRVVGVWLGEITRCVWFFRVPATENGQSK